MYELSLIKKKTKNFLAVIQLAVCGYGYNHQVSSDFLDFNINNIRILQYNKCTNHCVNKEASEACGVPYCEPGQNDDIKTGTACLGLTPS